MEAQERAVTAWKDVWDLILVVRYPSRKTLLSMITSEAYQAISHHRDDSLVRSVLLATDPAAIVAGAGAKSPDQ